MVGRAGDLVRSSAVKRLRSEAYSRLSARKRNSQSKRGLSYQTYRTTYATFFVTKANGSRVPTASYVQNGSPNSAPMIIP